MGAGEGALEARLVVDVRGDDLGAERGERLCRLRGRVARDRADGEAAVGVGKDRARETAALGSGRAEDGDHLFLRHLLSLVVDVDSESRADGVRDPLRPGEEGVLQRRAVGDRRVRRS